MINRIQEIISALRKKEYFESKLDYFDVQSQMDDDGQLLLLGTVLNKEDLTNLTSQISAEFPGLKINTLNVEILRNQNTRVLNVNKNITSMHSEKSFQSELTTQLLFGDPVEVLMDEGDWIVGRNVTDGYISYTYKSYLGKLDLPEITHIVKDPVVIVYDNPQKENVLTRIFGGTKTGILDETGDMVKIRANYDGWIKRSSLRAYNSLPADKDELRALVCRNAKSLLGVPYLWGGSSANGIDCSGLTQWSYRLAGITIRRDAHMQYLPEKIVEPPFLPGDVVLYGEQTKDRLSVTHASISLGGWTVIHSSRSRNGVYIDNVQEVDHLKKSFCAAIRYIL